jgi:hypothetical protein
VPGAPNPGVLRLTRVSGTPGMKAIKKIRRQIIEHPDARESCTLVRLVLALESEQEFHLQELYELDHTLFRVALDLLDEWRLDRYYTSKGQLLDIAMAASEARSGRA